MAVVVQIKSGATVIREVTLPIKTTTGDFAIALTPAEQAAITS